MNIAILGTGLMGGAIARRLLAVGHRVGVHNRSPERAAALTDHGAVAAATPAGAVAGAEFVLLVLADMEAIRATLLAPETTPELAGRTVIQMGTIAPAESRDLAAAATAAGARYLEAPVLGSLPEAETGTLIVMAGGAEEDLARCRPVLDALGSVRHLGAVGQAAAVKLALNQLIASLTGAFSLSLGLVRREGIPVEAFMEILRASALYAPTFDKKLPRMLNQDYARPNFPTRHLAKDIDLFLRQALRYNLDTGQLQGVRGAVERALALGYGDDDYSALYEGVTGSEPGS